MSKCSFSCFRDKEVINVANGCRLGFVCDLEIDCNDGRICAVCVPGRCGIFSGFRSRVMNIPWSCIERIGDDIILVNLAGAVTLDEKCDRQNKNKC